MSMETVGKNGRVYPRLFDHDQCREWYAEGASLADLADVFGVGPQAIKRVVDPKTYERMNERTRRFFQATCEDCGGPASKNPYNSASHLRPDRCVCKQCAGVRRSQEALQARYDADGNLCCSSCLLWQPASEFQSRHRGPLRIPRYECRACATRHRRERRWASAEATRAWDREYKKKRRTRLHDAP